MAKQKRKSWAVYAITKHGLEIGKKLVQDLDDVDFYVSKKFMDQFPDEKAIRLELPMGPELKKTFPQYDAHIFIISVGAVVRMIAPFLKDKKIDPAVLCVDDTASFTIPVLSGHVGRGNEFALKIAKILNNTPVVTTASDVTGTLTVDILGRELGWVLDDMDRNVTSGCAAVVNQESVLIVQETGDPNFWPLDKSLPKGVSYTTSFEGVDVQKYGMILSITDRFIKKKYSEIYDKSVIYRPKSLTLGLGCDRSTPFEVVERGIQKILKEHGLDICCVKIIASVDRKADEKAFLEIADKYGWEFITYSAEELDAIKNMPNPSETVKKFVGTKGVCEPSAVLAAGAKELLIEKKIYKEEKINKNLTVAVARIPFARRAVN
ncbi:Cobalt-precorrin 5A hydrolase [hydrothermal vent metagenome]|uniref:Cobalt-precorrin 5A hydrolase n=1 Tax=hydrothermal vent metagenome TaxID=652676 RepID=A0A3B1D0D3_9ZZZZ